MKLTYRDVIEDTVAYYSANPAERRAVDGVSGIGNCEYITDDMEMCAVGRKLDEEYLHKACNCGNAEDLIHELGMEAFQKDCQHLTDTNFWLQLQNFHDNATNWRMVKKPVGLSVRGQRVYQKLINQWGNV